MVFFYVAIFFHSLFGQVKPYKEPNYFRKITTNENTQLLQYNNKPIIIDLELTDFI